MGMAQPRCSSALTPSLPSLTLPHGPVAWPVPGNDCEPSNGAMCKRQPGDGAAWSQEITRPSPHSSDSRKAHTGRHTDAPACAVSQPDFPVGCSAVGRLFKGKLQAKKEKENDELWGCHGNGRPRGIGCLLKHALAHNKHTCVNCTPIARGRPLLRASALAARLLDFLSFFVFLFSPFL